MSTLDEGKLTKTNTKFRLSKLGSSYNRSQCRSPNRLYNDMDSAYGRVPTEKDDEEDDYYMPAQMGMKNKYTHNSSL